MPEREETVGDKRIVREYDDQGSLLRVRILPIPAPDAPPKRRLAFGRAKKAAPPAAAVGNTLPTAEEPETHRETRPPPAPVPTPAPTAPEPAAPEPEEIAAPVAPAPVAPPPVAAAPVVHVRFRGQAAAPGIDVVVEPFADAAAPVLSLVPAPIVFVEPEVVEPAPFVFREPEPVVAPPVVVPRFEIVALEPVEPPVQPAPEPVPEPAVVPMAEPVVEPEPEPAAPEPEVAAAEPERAVEPVAPVQPAPPAEAPEPPASYVALVPDVDGRVDALLARGDAPAKRRKRAPIPAPVFEPLHREPWEDRLDAALASR